MVPWSDLFKTVPNEGEMILFQSARTKVANLFDGVHLDFAKLLVVFKIIQPNTLVNCILSNFVLIFNKN